MGTIFKHQGSAASVTTGCDDSQIRQHVHWQQRLGQALPLAPAFGNFALWWCYRCQTAWHEQGRRGQVVYLRREGGLPLQSALLVDGEPLSPLQEALCPACAVNYLGGIPHLEEHPTGWGYRFTWERAGSPALFFCTLYTGPACLEADPLQALLMLPFDLPLAPTSSIRRVLQWLSALPDPAWDASLPLRSPHCRQLSTLYEPLVGSRWCGYARPAQQKSWGPVLLLLGARLPKDASFSLELLLACWRQIAERMAYVL